MIGHNLPGEEPVRTPRPGTRDHIPKGGLDDASHQCHEGAHASVRRRHHPGHPGPDARGPGRRDLPVSVHGDDHLAGGLRLRLDSRQTGSRRRLRQAGHDRRAARLEDLRQGDSQGLRRGAERGASRRIHGRPPLLLGRGSGHQQDLHLRRPQRSGQAAPAQDDQRLRRQVGRSGGAAHPLRAARPDAHRGAVERQGPRRPHGAGGVQQQRRFHRDPLDADRRKAAGRESRQGRRRLRVRRARPAAAKHDAHLVLHRLEQLHDGFRQDAAGQGGDEALRADGDGLGPPRPQAEEGAACPRRAAGDPFRAAAGTQLRLHDHRPDLEDLAHLRG